MGPDEIRPESGHSIESPLEPLRAGHRALLAQLEGLEEPGQGEAEILASSREWNGVLQKLGLDLAAHAAMQEKVLFPVLARSLPDSLPTLRSLQEEHEELVCLLDEILASGEPRSRLPRILWQDFKLLLREHIRKEEGAVFHLADRFLTLGEKQDIAGKMKVHQAKTSSAQGEEGT